MPPIARHAAFGAACTLLFSLYQDPLLADTMTQLYPGTPPAFSRWHRYIAPLTRPLVAVRRALLRDEKEHFLDPNVPIAIVCAALFYRGIVGPISDYGVSYVSVGGFAFCTARPETPI